MLRKCFIVQYGTPLETPHPSNVCSLFGQQVRPLPSFLFDDRRRKREERFRKRPTCDDFGVETRRICIYKSTIWTTGNRTECYFFFRLRKYMCGSLACAREKSINQSINHPIIQSINRLRIQWIDPSFHQSSINQSFIRSIFHKTNQQLIQ